MPWKRQIVIRDETRVRNPITVGCFMNEVGISVDKFFQFWVCFSRLGYGRPQVTLSNRSACQANT